MLFLNKGRFFCREDYVHGHCSPKKPLRTTLGASSEFNSGVCALSKVQGLSRDDDFNDSFIHVTCATDTNNMGSYWIDKSGVLDGTISGDPGFPGVG
jgi:hypothetical protein